MMTTSNHPLVTDYLRRLERAAGALPRHQRTELVAEIRSHLDAGITPGSSEADVRNLLDDLGPPEAIVAAARPEGSRPLPERGPREVLALLMLVTGLPMFVFGWLIGVGLLLWSPLWTARQKLLGVLVFPGGYLLTLTYGLLVGVRTRSDGCADVSPNNPILPESGGIVDCASHSSVTWTDTILPGIVIIVLVVAPLLMATYLYRAAGRRAAIA